MPIICILSLIWVIFFRYIAQKREEKNRLYRSHGAKVAGTNHKILANTAAGSLETSTDKSAFFTVRDLCIELH